MFLDILDCTSTTIFTRNILIYSSSSFVPTILIFYPKHVTYDMSDLEDIKFFCLNGDFSDGTFIVIVSIQRRNVDK